MMARKCIEKYLETHKSTYIGRYRCHSAVQTKKFEHKFHYYILDIQFKAIDVFVTIDYSGDEIVPTFSVNLHEQEQEYIIKDALNKILYFNQFKTILHCHVFEHFIETHTVDTILEPLDYRNILDYLEYHSGTNQETVDEFYTFFNPYLDRLLYNKNYKKFMDSIALLLDKILSRLLQMPVSILHKLVHRQFLLFEFHNILRCPFFEFSLSCRHNRQGYCQYILSGT